MVKTICPPWCERCLAESDESKLLNDLAHASNKSLQDLLREMRLGHHPNMRDQVAENAQQRAEEQGRRLQDFEERLRQRQEELSLSAAQDLTEGKDWQEVAQQILNDKLRQQLEDMVLNLKTQSDGMNLQDIEQTLKDLMDKGYIDLEGGRVKVTPQGARKLAKEALRKVLEKLQSRDLGPHSLTEIGYGSQRSASLRKLEVGDDYSLTNVEKTLLNALSRYQPRGELDLKVEDFEIHELIHQTKMTSGIIIDESGSMQGEKLRAAIETSLALAQLIRKEPKDGMKVILFSDHIKEVLCWEILNTTFSGGTTDIRAALRAFRRLVRSAEGDKQAYLITDTEPNTQDGRYVGFEIAAAGVLEEAWNYRREGITLNIIMLSQSPNLKALSSRLAKNSLGRVFFTSPQTLGSMLIEDYLKSRKKVFQTAA